MIHNKYYEIMKHFLNGYDKKIYGRELVKKVNISQKNVALTLEEMEKEGVLSSRLKGNVRYFSLNKSNPLIDKYVLLAEIESSIMFLKKYPKISQILSQIDNKNKIICVFGSYARGNQKKNSDLDLFIIGKFNEGEIKKIGQDYHLDINIKGCSKSDFISSLKSRSPLVNEILENHIIVSGYEDFVKEVIKQKW